MLAVKGCIDVAEGIAPERQCLSFRGTDLTDPQRLGEVAIKGCKQPWHELSNDAVVKLSLCPIGGWLDRREK
jgi:hypothetical protein